MGKITFKKIEKEALSIIDARALGFSLLDGIKGEIVDNPTGKLPEMKLDLIYNDDAIAACTCRENIDGHIDIFSTDANITYDLGVAYKVDKAVVRSYYHGGGVNYSVGEFKLYASNELATLYDDCNEVAHECGRELLHDGARNNADWLYEVEGEFRYYGVKIINSNPTDDITRLGYIGLYNEEFTHQAAYLNAHYPKSVIAGEQPTLLTDGRVFNDDTAVKVDGEQSFEINVANYDCLTKAWVIAGANMDISVEGFATPAVNELENGRYEYVFESEGTPLKNGKLNVAVKGNGFVDQVGAFSAKRTVNVDFDDVICENFVGIGSDILPMSFMPESIAAGYNEVYWALERERVKKTKTHVARMWFQPDWLCETYEQYKNGEYNFDCQKLQSVYRWLDVLKEAGSEVEFDFGWKVSSHAQEWFSLDIECKMNSAPKELDLFAKCCGATMKELIKNRGYDNIKYLTFYNEADGGNYTDHGDFVIGTGIDRRPYWAEMLKKSVDELKAVGVYDDLEMWVCETASEGKIQAEWISYMEEHCGDIVDCYTAHKYSVKHAAAPELFVPMTEAANGKPVVMSECGQTYGIVDFDWNMNEVQLFHDVVSHGVSGALIWCLNGMDITDPCSFKMNNEIDFWACVHYPGGIDNVRENYYRWAMLSHYIPNHAQSVTSEIVSGTGENIRASAFKFGDDYTVVLELNDENAGEREIEIKLNKAVGKKFYKHVYRMPCKRDGNATLPSAEKAIFADDVLRDTVDSDYQEVVYTTIAPTVQVELPQCEVFLTEGQKYVLSGRVIDGTGDITFELAAEIGGSAKFDATNRTAMFAENAKKGDMFAVKATSVKHPEATSVVIFKYMA